MWLLHVGNMVADEGVFLPFVSHRSIPIHLIFLIFFWHHNGFKYLQAVSRERA